MVRQSIITLALLHKFVYEFIGNNTYIILDRTALKTPQILRTLTKANENRRFLFLSSPYDFVRGTLGTVECSRILPSLDTALLTSFPPFFPFQLL